MNKERGTTTTTKKTIGGAQSHLEYISPITFNCMKYLLNHCLILLEVTGPYLIYFIGAFPLTHNMSPLYVYKLCAHFSRSSSYCIPEGTYYMCITSHQEKEKRERNTRWKVIKKSKREKKKFQMKWKEVAFVRM